MTDKAVFDVLTPDTILTAVEAAVGLRLTGLTVPHASYINRVYELQSFSGERLIAKFYRPGRWSRAAIEQEHEFVLDCAAAEIPAVAPRVLADGSTLAECEGILFAVFEKRSGREFEPTSLEDWTRIGQILGRVHAVGAQKAAPDRLKLHPQASTRADLEFLEQGGFVSPAYREQFRETTGRILEAITPLFAGREMIRIHGDCHRGNILERGELMLIDFDDMLVGPPVHDLWLLLPDHYRRCRPQMDAVLDGYEQFRDFDYAALNLIEPLRFMRIVYYLAWCARQAHDNQFRLDQPDWGSERFWEREIIDLRHQLQVIMEHKVAFEEDSWEEAY